MNVFDYAKAVILAGLFLLVAFGPDNFPPIGPVGQRASNGSEYQLAFEFEGIARPSSGELSL